MCPIFKNLLVLYPNTRPFFQADRLNTELNLLNSSLALGMSIQPVKATHLGLLQVCLRVGFVT